MVTVVMVEEKRPLRLIGEERRRATPRSAKPKAGPSSRDLPADDGGATATWNPSPVWNPPSSEPVSADERFRRISLCAYYRAEKRGFAPGHAWGDWLDAEREVDAAVAAQSPKATSAPTDK